MAENDFISQLLLLQQLQAMEDAKRKRQQQEMNQQQGGGGMSPGQMNQGYNMYSKFMTPTAASPTAAPSADASAQVGGYGSAAPGAFTPAAAASPEGMSIGADLGYSGTSAGSLSSAAYPLGYIAAAIGGQHLLSNATDRSFKGRATKDAFGGSGATEPWLAYAYQKLGIDSPTTGETLDADVKNGNYGTALKDSPAHALYYMDPFGSLGYDFLNDKGGLPGKVAARAIFPLGWLKDLIS